MSQSGGLVYRSRQFGNSRSKVFEMKEIPTVALFHGPYFISLANLINAVLKYGHSIKFPECSLWKLRENDQILLHGVKNTT